MHRASLNHTYRLVWSDVESAFVAVAENVKGRGKSSRSGRALGAITLIAACALLAVASSQLGAQTLPATLPTGGSVVAGSASIATSGTTMTVTQTTARMAADWQSFNIGQGHTVNFVQPSSTSVALNRVLGADVSVIQGALNANGQVFLINPNGVLFTTTAQVNVGSIVASTLNLSTADFMAGNYQFEGSSANAIVNQGRITAMGDGSAGGKGGTVALIAAKITNTGMLTANQGNVLLGAGAKVTLDLGGPVKLQVTQGAIDALIEQGGAIRADGGLVYLTAKAAGSLASTVINHTGITEAQTLATGEKGQIYLLGGMESDRIVVGGTLNASAPHGGDGGFIETSAARVNIASGIDITTAASQGTTGEWLIDPYNITIAASGASGTAYADSFTSAATSTILASDLTAALTNNNVTIQTGGTAGDAQGSGDITVTASISKSGATTTTLTLKAHNDIIVNAGVNITATGGALNVVLNSDSDATGGGRILMGNGTASSSNNSINSNGGNITLSGGTDVTTGYAKGYASGNATYSGNGVVLSGTTLNSSGGNIVIRGEGADTIASNGVDGVWFRTGTYIDSGTGTISVNGKAPSTTGFRNGVITEQNQLVRLISASTSANAISIIGDATTSTPAGADSCCAFGVFLWNGSLIAATGVGGGITMHGQGGTATSGGGGLQLEANSYILANGGAISLTGAKGTGSVYEDIVIAGTVGFASTLNGAFSGIPTSPVTSSSSNISITADSLSNTRVFSGGAAAGAVQTSGTLTIAPRTNGKALSMQTSDPGGTGVWINPTSMFGASGLFKTGFTKLVFGSSTTGDVTLNNYTFDNDTELNTGANAVLGAVGIANHALTVNMTGSGTITNTGAVAVSKLNLNGSTSAATLGNTSNAIGTLAANVASLSLVNSSALTIGTVGATNGMTATGAIDIATLSGDLTVSQNVTSGNTGTSALVLNAGKSAAAGTATGGNIVLSGSRTFTTGGGGRTILYSGDSSASTGLSSLVTTAGGTLTYSADEAATPVPTGGTHAIYRGSAPVTITAPVTTGTTNPAQQAAIQSVQTTAGSQTPTVDASVGNIAPSGGFMHVFVVAGGIKLPSNALDTDDSSVRAD
jgi:filamentous hemagglutinin family protein